ncbi:hypothetical protein [Carboxylicivirga taeanensis]|uniref:hypothetical protein n=1 Tax=Carboxylicivirga taeanensis TaxID=1416875 RepID=UPI003F6DBF9B
MKDDKLNRMLLMLMLLIWAINANSQLKTKANYKALLSNARCDNWQAIKHEEGVDIRYRWLTFGDTLKTRELMLSFSVRASVQNVLHYLRSESALSSWNLGVRDLNVWTDSDSTWLTHMIYDIPYPLSQQDLVTQNTIVESSGDVLIDVDAAPALVSRLPNVNRQQFYFGQWRLKTQPNGKTAVTFSLVSLSKSRIPRFIRDPIIQNKLLGSFIKLKELSANRMEIVSVGRVL